MKSTTIRFGDHLYRQLEISSRLTGLPINSIVVIACLEWLRDNQGSPLPMAQMVRMPATYRRLERMTSPLASMPLGVDPIAIFTATAQQALSQASEDAERQGTWIGTQHLLHGLAAVPDGRAAKALVVLRVEVASIVAGVDAGERPAEAHPQGLPTSRVRRVLKHAKEEAGREGSPQVGTDHLLLGLLLEGESQVAEALGAAGLTYSRARDTLSTLPAEP